MTILAHALLPLWVALALLAGDGWLGIYLADTERPTIAEVVPDSPAARAGLLVGDVITAVDGDAVASAAAFAERVRTMESGASVDLTVRRGERDIQIVVVLGQRPEEAPAPSDRARGGRQAEPPAVPGQESAPARPWLGLVVRASDDGLIVDSVAPRGPSARAGVRAGDVLRAIGERDVVGFDGLDQALGRLSPGVLVTLHLNRNGEALALDLRVGGAPAATPSPVRGEIDPALTRVRREIARLRAEQAELAARLEAIGRRLEALERRLERDGRDG